MEKVTIKDIAREAGVSISTVSNALNGVDVLKPETKEHILEVASRTPLDFSSHPFRDPTLQPWQIKCSGHANAMAMR